MGKNVEGYQDPTATQAVAEVSKREIEEKKTFLRLYQRAVREEEEIKLEIEKLRLDAEWPSKVSDGMPRGSRTGTGDLSSYAARMDELMRELKEKLEHRLEVRQKIIQRIEMLPSEGERMVLRLRYIHGFKWEKIATEMHYTWKGVHKIHGRALKNLKSTWKYTKKI